MKNIVISSRDVDVKIGFLVLAGVVGFSIPMIDENGWWPLNMIGSLIGLAVGVFVWAVFELIKPSRLSWRWPRWRLIELWGLPMAWVLLITAFVIWLHHFLMVDAEQVRSILDEFASGISA